MELPSSMWLGLSYAVSEIGLSLFKRSKTESSSRDGGTIALLWITIIVSIGASMYVRSVTAWSVVPALIALRPAWLVMFIAAIGLRWWSIQHLGRFFTVNVAVAADQTVVDDGPYRWVRHPSYTGALAAFVAYTLYVGHGIGIFIVMIPVTAAFLMRIIVEEAALAAGLGEPYRAYMRRTKRLVPFVF